MSHAARESLKPQSIKQVIFGVAMRGAVRIQFVFLVTTARAKVQDRPREGHKRSPVYAY